MELKQGENFLNIMEMESILNCKDGKCLPNFDTIPKPVVTFWRFVNPKLLVILFITNFLYLCFFSCLPAIGSVKQILSIPFLHCKISFLLAFPYVLGILASI